MRKGSFAIRTHCRRKEAELASIISSFKRYSGATDIFPGTSSFTAKSIRQGVPLRGREGGHPNIDTNELSACDLRLRAVVQSERQGYQQNSRTTILHDASNGNPCTVLEWPKIGVFSVTPAAGIAVRFWDGDSKDLDSSACVVHTLYAPHMECVISG